MNVESVPGRGPRWPRYAAALFGLIWFLEIGGGPTLIPTHTKLIMSGDWIQHWFGWLMFRREAWALPLGTIASVPYPVGTTVGFTDANPLISLLLKPFSPLLPAEFQFIGLWLASCFVLQGYMGAALASTVTDDAREQMFGGFLFVLSPVLLARIGHDTLAAHWLLLGTLYLGLREYADDRSARRGAWLAAGIAILASTIHPFLAAMCWTLAMAALGRLWRSHRLSARLAFAAAATATAAVLAVFALLGYFSTAATGASGFGQYSADMLALVNPDQFSRMLFTLRLTTVSWEGIGFLGLGGLVAAAVAIAAAVRWRPRLPTGVWAIVVACVLMAVFALSADITIAGRHVIDVSWLYAPVPQLTRAFRASGRFVWGLHYLALLFGIWGASRLLRTSRRAVGMTLLAVTVALQATDLRMDSLWATKDFKEVPFGDFKYAVGFYRHLALVPMEVRSVCVPYQEMYVFRYMLHAYRLKTTFNSGYFSRVDPVAIRAACDRLEEDVSAGRLDPQTIYIVAPDHVPKFQAANAACGRVDGDWVCVSRDSDVVFRTWIETGHLPE